MSLEDRQRLDAYDFNRSSWSTLPPVLSRESKRLDHIAAQAERDRQQRKAIELYEADLIAHAKQGQIGPQP